jgi:hypothetical protein
MPEDVGGAATQVADLIVHDAVADTPVPLSEDPPSALPVAASDELLADAAPTMEQVRAARLARFASSR